MSYTLNLPTNKGISTVQVFNCATDNASTWYDWKKPRGKTMCNIICIGGGAGGGGGRTGTAGSARGGGGGGGGASISRVTIPIFLLPNILYISVGLGGTGGAANSNGTAGNATYVSVMPNNTARNVVVYANPGGAGQAGTTTDGGAGGAAGSIATVANGPLVGNGVYNFIAGRGGTAGGNATGAVGVESAIPTSSALCTGGTGGGGTTSADFAGGEFTAVADTFLSNIRPATSASGSNPGSNGVSIFKPLFAFGGTGGGAANSAVGGNGGDGGFGSGGGGGGAGTTGGTGGRGGDGLVIITCW